MKIERRNFIKISALAGVARLSGVYSNDMLNIENTANTSTVPDGWITTTPRDEIKPVFAYKPKGGPNRQGSFVIESDQREGLLGRWTKTFPVKGSKYYRFAVQRKYTGKNLPVPMRRAGVASVRWVDQDGKSVKHDEPPYVSFNPTEKPIIRTARTRISDE